MTLFCSAQEFDSLCREIAGKADRLRLLVKGGSMDPFIRSGDWVTVALFHGEKSAIVKGDIILFRKDEALYMHRVIRRGAGGLVAKGDMSFGCDGIVPIGDVLARAVSIERGGRLIDLRSKSGRLVGVILADMSMIIQYPMLFLRKVASLCGRVLAWVQSLKVYRRTVKKLFSASIIVRDATSDDEGELRDLYLMAGHDIRDGIARIKDEGHWLVAERNDKIVGGITVSRYEKDPSTWVIFGLEVKPRLRGLGIGEELVKHAILKAKGNGAKEMGLIVNKKSTPAIKLYKKLGFNITNNFPRDFNRSVDELYLLHKL